MYHVTYIKDGIRITASTHTKKEDAQEQLERFVESKLEGLIVEEK